MNRFIHTKALLGHSISNKTKIKDLFEGEGVYY